MTSHHDAAIAGLDLDPIKVKLMHEESGEGWSLEQANAVEKEYRRFLYLMKRYPDEQAAPLVDVDTFWHYHILDTMKYAVDCEAVFGYFLHHFPYVGLRGEEDEALHHDMGERMKELYEATFGEDYLRAGATAWSGMPTTITQQTAWSGMPTTVTAKTAWSGMPTTITQKTAWSGMPTTVTAKTAWSGMPTTITSKAARSGAAATQAAWPDGAPEMPAATANDSLQPAVHPFFAERPRLPQAAA